MKLGIDLSVHGRIRPLFAGAVGLATILLTFFSGVRQAIAQSPTIDRDILLLQKILKQRPDAELYYRLGDLYVQKGRQTGDITYFNLGGNSLREALKLQPDLGPAHRHLAFVLYSLHDFAGAAVEARQAIKLDPNDSYAYGVLGDAELETGEYPQAEDTYGRMIAMKGDLYSYSRRSGLETIRGESDRAIADLNRAIEAGIQAGEPAEGIAWAQYTLAEDFFLMGRLGDANRLGEESLKTFPNYHRAFAILGQVSAAEMKLDRSADFYRRAIAVIPLPEYAAALGDVYLKMGHRQEAEQQKELVEFIAKLNVLNKVLYNRVLVDYYADHDIDHQQAVDLAAGEYHVRHDVYGDDALAWALYRDGKLVQAQPHIIAALRFKTVDARIYFHAGMIFATAGHTELARANLARALAINPHFQPILDDAAVSEYAALGGTARPQYAKGNDDIQH
jgi:tetratricopeptide (TPR) repeat protein